MIPNIPIRKHAQPIVIAGLAFFLGLSIPADAEVKTEVRDYRAGDTALRGYLAWDDAFEGPRPGVLVVHEWWGHDEYARSRAEQLAKAGFTAFALDMYGAGQKAEHPKDAQQFMEALLSDLPAAEQRFAAAFKELNSHPSVDKNSTGAIGYCLGGGLALYMGRLDLGLDAVVSFHGSLQPPTQMPASRTQSQSAPMLVFTGGADPMAPAEQVSDFVATMVSAGAEVSLTSYPDVQHSFTVPGATERGRKTGLPLAYDAATDADSWRRSLAFLADRLGMNASR